MTELAVSGDTEDPGISDFPATSELNATFAELLESAKKDILSNVQESIDQIYADFEYVESETEGVQAQGNPEANTNTAVATKIDNFIQPKPSELGEGSSSDSFRSLAEEFSVAEKTAPAIDSNLAEIVKSLLLEKLPKDKLEEVQSKYLRPENCTNLVAPKINKQIWQQLRQETRNNDSAFQKAQSLLLSGLYAVLQTCNGSSGEQKNVLTHAAVLLLSSNRELVLKRRDLIRPDLNKQYASLCNPSTPVSSFLFGDELNKEVEELTKSHKLSNKVTPKKRMEPYKVPSGRGARGRGRFSQSGGRGKTPASSFLGRGRGQTWSQQNPKQTSTKTQ